MILLPTYKLKTNDTVVRFVFDTTRYLVSRRLPLFRYDKGPITDMDTWVSINEYIRVPYGFNYNRS